MRPTTWMATEGERAQGLRLRSFMPWLEEQIDKGTLTELKCPTSITSLPERLGECEALQALNLESCDALTSLPDLSGLEQLEVKYLPDHLKPWKYSGYKAFSVAS